MTLTRKPAAFRVAGDRSEESETPRAQAETAEPVEGRKPRPIARDIAIVTPAKVDVFDADDDDALREPPPPITRKKRSRLAAIFLSAFGALVSLAIWLWVDRLIRDLFAQAGWLGWVAFGLAIVAALSLLVILAREIWALRRLASVEKMRADAEDILASNNERRARALVGELTAFLSSKPETAAGRRTLAELEGEIIDGKDLVRLAESELMPPLDRRAHELVLDAAKRVSIVTAVSPRALVDIGYVLFEASRLIRRLAELYGARPGTLGFFRLGRDVLAHLAVTGSIAVGDGIVQQLIGHGLAAKLSAKLGEGVVNGMMTVRIGIAAMETVRPLPYAARRRPRIGDFVAALSSFAARKADEDKIKEN
ncbi:MAG TPA: TIGR01620 family protein [Rhizobiaceae bacterium]|nr:TIGR01620 family protein [Rhizobiaceae bacterium]